MRNVWQCSLYFPLSLAFTSAFCVSSSLYLFFLFMLFLQFLFVFLVLYLFSLSVSRSLSISFSLSLSLCLLQFFLVSILFLVLSLSLTRFLFISVYLSLSLSLVPNLYFLSPFSLPCLTCPRLRLRLCIWYDLPHNTNTWNFALWVSFVITLVCPASNNRSCQSLMTTYV